MLGLSKTSREVRAMSLIITKNHVVTLAYNVTTPDGEMVDPGDDPLVYLHGGYDDLFPKLEEALEGKTVGDKLEVTLEADDAFGEFDEELVRIEPRSSFPYDVAVGSECQAGEGEPIFNVVEVNEEKVVLNGNHPLAGFRLVFHTTVSDVRAASHEEITHGHVHMPGHHHH